MNIHHFAFSLPTSQGDRKGRPYNMTKYVAPARIL